MSVLWFVLGFALGVIVTTWAVEADGRRQTADRRRETAGRPINQSTNQPATYIIHGHPTASYQLTEPDTWPAWTRN